MLSGHVLELRIAVEEQHQSVGIVEGMQQPPCEPVAYSGRRSKEEKWKTGCEGCLKGNFL